MIDLAALDRIKVDEVVRLRDLLREPADQVCLLSPYRDRLSEAEPLSRRINAYLATIDFSLGESGYALVFVKGDQISVQIISGAGRAITNWHEGAGRVSRPLGCADIDRVLVIKVQDLWPWLVFGEER